MNLNEHDPHAHTIKESYNYNVLSEQLRRCLNDDIKSDWRSSIEKERNEDVLTSNYVDGIHFKAQDMKSGRYIEITITDQVYCKSIKQKLNKETGKKEPQEPETFHYPFPEHVVENELRWCHSISKVFGRLKNKMYRMEYAKTYIPKTSKKSSQAEDPKPAA